MSLSPDVAAQAALSSDARQASAAQALASRIKPGQPDKKPVKAFGKILDSLTPEKAEQAGMSPDAVKTLTVQAQNKSMNPGPSKDKKLKEACQGFEAVFIGQMIKEMRKTVPKDGILDSKYEEQYVSMFDEELSKTLTKQGGIGLTEFMERQLVAQGKAKDRQPVPDSQKGLRTSASSTMTVSAGSKFPARGLRDRHLNGLRPAGLGSGPEIIPAPNSALPGAIAAARAAQQSGQGALPAGGSTVSPGTLAGTPSQHLGAPGAQYLQGEDAQLAAQDGALPVSGEITSGFGWRKDPFTGQRAWHNGMDIAAPEGTPVHAWRDGTVVAAGPEHGYGNLVVVEHPDGVKSYYGHNKAMSVTVGQQVKAGQVIAQVGQTGRATGSHLHFEVRVNDTAVNPATLSGTMLAAAPEPEVRVPDL